MISIFRIGKLTNSVVGDGALINHYRELNLLDKKSRPGLAVKLDGNIFNFNLIGVETITNDIFNPDFYGGRVFVRPLSFTGINILENLTFGYTLINNKYVNSSTVYYYNDYCFDI